MNFLEDAVLGETVEIGSHTFTAEAIKAFAAQYDPQPFHLDETAAARSHFGALCASGWHTCAVGMRLLVDHRRRIIEDLRARGEPIAKWGPSPGFRELKWLKPVYAGDTVTYATEPLERKVSQSRPGFGILFSRNSGTNQHGEPVYSLVAAVFVERRPR